jgi:DNA polymerase-3 subunit alpha
VQWVRPHITKRGDPMAFVHLEDLQGSIEVVVFPRVYAATRDLWQEDKILIVRGRVDADRGDPKILCDSAQDYLLTARPVDDPVLGDAAVAPAVTVPRTTATPSVPRQGNGVHREANAHRKADEGHDGNGARRGNGHNGNGDRMSREHKSQPAPKALPTRTQQNSPPVPRHIDLILRRTGDARQDTARAEAAYGLLAGSTGRDTFSFMVVNDKGRVRVDFPQQTIQWSPDLAESLSELLGQDAIRVA